MKIKLNKVILIFLSEFRQIPNLFFKLYQLFNEEKLCLSIHQILIIFEMMIVWYNAILIISEIDFLL